MILKKLTIGTVIQEYDTDKGKFISQEFICGDEVNWEDENGDFADGPEDAYCSFEMIQPEYEDQPGTQS